MPTHPLHTTARALATAATAFAISMSAQAADNHAYVSGSSGAFGLLDLDTGSFNLLGSSGQTLAGLGFLNGTLYASSYNTTSQLYKVSTADGSLTAVGPSSGQTFYDFGATTTGLYGVGTNGNLYGISTVDGHTTLIGSLGIPLVLRVESLSSNAPALYFINGSSLYTLNTSTGAASLVGSPGGTIGAMTMAGQTLYGGDSGTPKSVYTIDTLTGATGTPHAVTGSAGFGIFLGLAAVSAVPEPGTWLMLAAGGVALLSRRRAVNAGA